MRSIKLSIYLCYLPEKNNDLKRVNLIQGRKEDLLKFTIRNWIFYPYFFSKSVVPIWGFKKSHRELSLAFNFTTREHIFQNLIFDFVKDYLNFNKMFSCLTSTRFFFTLLLFFISNIFQVLNDIILIINIGYINSFQYLYFVKSI